jgi:hypothetical protein
MSVRDVVQAAAGVGGGAGEYIEDVFSTYLYTGTGSAQTITNGIDLDGEGGLVWAKIRETGSHQLHDTARGINYSLYSDDSSAQDLRSDFSSLNSNGFTLTAGANINVSSSTYVSWTFRKSPKFFDVVTWTGDGVNGRQIPHNLGSVPGMVVVKCTNDATRWSTWHRSLTAGHMMVLDTTGAEILISASAGGGVSSADASTFTVNTGSSLNWVNGSTKTYVAYIFAHDAGGFGDDGTENVISCGSYEGTGSQGNEITLGFEPQWLLIKNADAAEDWYVLDNMRGIPATYNTDQSKYLLANTSGAEAASNLLNPTPTGFYIDRAGNPTNSGSNTYIYIAIRRGPMKTPESGTEVFSPVVISSPTSTQTVTTNFPVDMTWSNEKAATSYGTLAIDRLRSNSITSNRLLQTTNENAEGGGSWGGISFQSNTSIIDSVWNYLGGGSSTPVIYWNFRRAPGFFDVVCYDGSGVLGLTLNHNLSAVPEMIWVKNRSASNDNWYAYHSSLGNTKYLGLNTPTM